MSQVIIAGATGAVGSALVSILAADARCESAVALVRRPVDLGVDTVVIDFNAMADHAEAFEGRDIALCCLGTTIAAVGGDKAAFRRVDHDYPLEFFRLAIAAGVKQLSIVTATGASAGSMSFYSRTKGEVENSARKLASENGARLTILHPAMLLTPDGQRDGSVLGGKNKRTGERLAQRALQSAGWMLGPLQDQVAVKVETVAAAMWRDALAGGEGVTVLSNRQIIALGKG
ncbi:MAG: nucleoside-diphosphate-sugar epimerase [Myxococcota bacterium]|jgi:nucleoside-diphosphate-sugar epimerase